MPDKKNYSKNVSCIFARCSDTRGVNFITTQASCFAALQENDTVCAQRCRFFSLGNVAFIFGHVGLNCGNPTYGKGTHIRRRDNCLPQQVWTKVCRGSWSAEPDSFPAYYQLLVHYQEGEIPIPFPIFWNGGFKNLLTGLYYIWPL